ncbi:MAG TPA: tRNA (adenosine(37)-N6)-threonylcarbamoyltransferase complex ATPase subunit type 1 TsaE [Cytophagales bacterium]|nr:tRNA (adenosine(37)-N6)-threonylcarbamoyltransferase complex ATPase subunit type 1 TsaE [Cytophagales bacterium]
MDEADLQEIQLINKDLKDLPEIAKTIISFAGSLKIWLFYGEMGSGKTTLIKEICSLFKVNESVTSPTYSIVNEYMSDSGKKLYHFDFYRVRSEAEVLDIGYEEYFYSDNYCFVEWPEKIPNLIPGIYLKVDIRMLQDSSRLIIVTKHE